MIRTAVTAEHGNEMRTNFCAACIGIFLLATTAYAQTGSILDFYDYADSVAMVPPVDKPMHILCHHTVEGKIVTFIGFGNDSVARIAVVTLAPLTDPAKEVSLTVDFKDITPSAGKITTWGYMYDRNGDGKIDYLALVGGAAAYKGADFSESMPKQPKAMTRKDIDYLLAQCRIIFNHYADDNYDGTLDALVQVDMDPTRDWVDHRILVRSSAFGKSFDDVRSFRIALQKDAVDTVAHMSNSVPYYPVGKPRSVIDGRMFEDRTAILSLINRAAASCKLQKEQLPRRSIR
jgi:hypothetical protein